jgi:hypothetical protein
MAQHLTLNVEMANDAFSHHPEDELARLLRYAACQLEVLGAAPGTQQHLLDYNGNTVGAWAVSDE